MRKKARAAPAAGLAGSLWREALAEPGRLSESLASFALRHLGPGAGAAVARLRAARPEADAAALRALVVTRGRRAVVSEGAFVGGPFLFLVPFAFCGALLSQARAVLELAAVEGRDATDPERSAELLVLQGVCGDTAAARAALEAPGSGPRGANGPGRLAVLRGLTSRMARLLGLITADDGAGRLVRVGRWALLIVVLLVGLVAPLVWLPYTLPQGSLHLWYEEPGDSSARPGRADVTALDLPDGVTAYLCGPLPFLRSVRGDLIGRGAAAGIHYEVFGPDLWLGAES